MEMGWNWETVNFAASVIGAATALVTVWVNGKGWWKKSAAWLRREQEIRRHAVKQEGLSQALSFTNLAKPPDRREAPLDAGEIWGATQSGRTPFFINAPFTDFALAKREA